jgi:transposase
MGYRRVTADLLWNIYSHWRAGESNRAIAKRLGLDKKTANRYVERIAELGIPNGTSYPEVLERLSTITPANRKPKPASTVLLPLEQEIRSLIAGSKDEHREPMKPKTAWEVIVRRHELFGKTSYESFKRFVRDRSLASTVNGATTATVRVETEPGKEIQIDYGRAGTKVVGNARRSIHAFVGILSCSRLPYVQFGLSQDEVAFSESVAAMFAFYGGATERINLDNLKAGILAADVYDPTLNRSFAELCEHYGTLADPARVASPKDKGKVERFVQVARELFRQLHALNPDATLDELNAQALAWCRDTYGKRRHGTTGLKPLEVFEDVERSCLKPLAEVPFEVARWDRAKVHPDQFITLRGKYYGLPAAFIGKQVDIRATSRLVTIYHAHRPVRQYPVSSKRRYYLAEDFPAYAEPFKAGSYASFLVGRASRCGHQAETLIRTMLQTGGNLAIRRAQGCLSIIEGHLNDLGLSHVLGTAIAERVFSPDRLRVLFDADASQSLIAFPISQTGRAMARSATYYLGSDHPKDIPSEGC